MVLFKQIFGCDRCAQHKLRMIEIKIEVLDLQDLANLVRMPVHGKIVAVGIDCK